MHVVAIPLRNDSAQDGVLAIFHDATYISGARSGGMAQSAVRHRHSDAGDRHRDVADSSFRLKQADAAHGGVDAQTANRAPRPKRSRFPSAKSSAH